VVREARTMKMLLMAALLTASPVASFDGIITRLPTRQSVVALTFDACEAGQVVHLDKGILSVLQARGVPFTVFASGKFVRDNADAVRELSRWPGVRIENHSWDHPRDMTLLADDAVLDQVSRTDDEIERVTGHRPTLFRFPGGNADQRVIADVRATGHRIVHWRWAEGDPAKAISAEQLVSQTRERTRAGDILILHINGRGWHTAEALPALLDALDARGLSVVDLPNALDAIATAPSGRLTQD
jgi:peptidoglycan/xylan/chitin deacetylase (PgdA/CDA1 family)